MAMVVLEDSESSQEFKPSLLGKTAKFPVKHADGGCERQKYSSDRHDDGHCTIGRRGTPTSHTTLRPFACFHRQEIKIEKRRPIGEGYHGIVYEIIGIHLRDDFDNNTHGRRTLEEQQARQRLCDRLQRSDGSARYVIKHLHPRLLLDAGGGCRTAIENAAIDLVSEANFLQQLHHPNILPLVGLARGGACAFRGGYYDSFFFITERLSETLAQRVQRWKQSGVNRYQPSDDGDVHARLLIQKYDYALQIAQALRYLHDQQLVFRDLKPNNIGFSADDPDRIQIFDFGLCRKLPTGTADGDGEHSSSSSSDVYCMSGGVGTRRYCAVEVCQHRPYNTKADVYSWSMVFLEMLTLDKPFADFSKEDHDKFVCEMGGTPNLSQHNLLSDRIQTLLRNAWSRNVAKRWTMAQVCQELELLIGEEQQLQQEGEDAHSRFSSAAGGDQHQRQQEFARDRRRTKAMDRKDDMVNLEQGCSANRRDFLSALA